MNTTDIFDFIAELENATTIPSSRSNSLLIITKILMQQGTEIYEARLQAMFAEEIDFVNRFTPMGTEAIKTESDKETISGTTGLAEYLDCGNTMAFTIIKSKKLMDSGIQYKVGNLTSTSPNTLNSCQMSDASPRKMGDFLVVR